jgi:hypothetical protein
LQNVSQKSANKRIFLNDIRRAIAGAYLTIFPGKTMYCTSYGVAPMGYVLNSYLYCVKGNSNGTASVLWCLRFHGAVDCISPLKIVNESNVRWCNFVKIQTNAVPSDIYPQLKIQNNEIKIIVECAFHYWTDPSWNYKFTDGRLCKNVPSEEAFGFYALKLKWIGSFFPSVVIFTPKPGLFDEIKPSES